MAKEFCDRFQVHACRRYRNGRRGPCSLLLRLQTQLRARPAVQSQPARRQLSPKNPRRVCLIRLKTGSNGPAPTRLGARRRSPNPAHERLGCVGFTEETVVKPGVFLYPLSLGESYGLSSSNSLQVRRHCFFVMCVRGSQSSIQSFIRRAFDSAGAVGPAGTCCRGCGAGSGLAPSSTGREAPKNQKASFFGKDTYLTRRRLRLPARKRAVTLAVSWTLAQLGTPICTGKLHR